ncbi:hypothetical protein [Peribacillus sp. R9-11]|uniref:hypothetical protein n=1 Tax=Peribacillus sp. R9-11 TaxID=3073271 RepID=UPI0028696EFA|nr:hypothetical protein [Peribacillus sp. R9-11]WMX55071.1 hypothetical protein RE409_23985 [Peribacillus sp. R9-11]
MKKISKLGFLSIMLVVLMFSSTVAFAEEGESIGVTTESPVTESGGITVFGTGTPTTSHNLVSSGRMTFSGSAQGSNLFTNKYFKGKSQVKVYVKNNHSTKLTLKIYKSTSVISVYSETLDSGHTLTAFPSGLDKNGLYYIKFAAPSNFSGYVE